MTSWMVRLLETRWFAFMEGLILEIYCVVICFTLLFSPQINTKLILTGSFERRQMEWPQPLTCYILFTWSVSWSCIIHWIRSVLHLSETFGALDSGDIKKISECVMPCALVKSGTNTLSKTLQVRRASQTAFGIPPYLLCPSPCPSSNLPHPNLNAWTPALHSLSFIGSHCGYLQPRPR